MNYRTNCKNISCLSYLNILTIQWEAELLKNCFVNKTKSWISLLKEILIMLNKDRLVTITNCMMHFLSYQTVLFLLIFYVGEGTLCVCVYMCVLVIKSARRNLFLPKWECDWEGNLKDDPRTALHSCSQTHSYSENVLILVRCVKAPEAVFFIRKRDLWHQKIRCTQNTKLIWKRCTYTSKPHNKMYFLFQGSLSCVIPFPSLFIPWMHVELRYTFLRDYVFLCTYVACDCVCVCSHVPCCCYFYAQGSSSNLSAHHEKIFRS